MTAVLKLGPEPCCFMHYYFEVARRLDRLTTWTLDCLALAWKMHFERRKEDCSVDSCDPAYALKEGCKGIWAKHGLLSSRVAIRPAFLPDLLPTGEEASAELFHCCKSVSGCGLMTADGTDALSSQVAIMLLTLDVLIPLESKTGLSLSLLTQLILLDHIIQVFTDDIIYDVQSCLVYREFVWSAIQSLWCNRNCLQLV